MKRLHNRPRYDTLQTEVRINKGSVGRWVYLILVFALFFWLFNIFVGPKLFFRAEGLVAQDRQVVAVSYTAEIKELRVKDAARVERGTVLALVRSPEMEESIARLSIDFSELRIREAQLNTRMGVLQAVRQVADDRARGMSSLRKNLESLYQRQLATAAQFSASLEDEYEGVFDRERIVAEHQSTQQEINKLQTVLKQSAAALAAIKNTYSAGVITAPIEGLVSGINVASGSVVRAGDPLLEIFTGPKYVIAYATPGALEAIVVGQDVTVEYGVKTLVGKIADVLPDLSRFTIGISALISAQRACSADSYRTC